MIPQPSPHLHHRSCASAPTGHTTFCCKLTRRSRIAFDVLNVGQWPTSDVQQLHVESSAHELLHTHWVPSGLDRPNHFPQRISPSTARCRPATHLSVAAPAGGAAADVAGEGSGGQDALISCSPPLPPWAAVSRRCVCS